MIKCTWLLLINEIWISTCFQAFVKKKKKLFWLFNTVYRDIFWDNYHTVKISYRYNPSSVIAADVMSSFTLFIE